jgi:hypothetical protein
MAAPNPSMVGAQPESSPPADAGSRAATQPTGVPVPASAGGGVKRKRQGTHVDPVGAIPAPAAGMLLTPPVKPAVKPPLPKQRLKKPAVKKVMMNLAKKASLVTINAAVAGAPATDGDSAHQLFVDSPARYGFPLFSIQFVVKLSRL